MSEKTKQEVDPDLQAELDKANSWHERVEILLIAILRALKPKP